MTDQLRLVPGRSPEDVLGEAHQLGPFPRVVALFSGGHDSCVMAHRCRAYYDELAFIDTGTAVPGVRAFVEQYAEWLGESLRIIDAGGRTIAAMNIAFNTGAVKRPELLNTVLPELRQAVARLNNILSLNAG